MANITTDFKGVSDYRETQLLNRLETNLKMWIDWAFLRVGAWSDINIPTEGPNSSDFSLLRRVEDPSFTNGTIYESARKDWVWEEGVNYEDVNGDQQNPIESPSIKVDSVITVPSYINYPLGRVIFSSALPSSSVVQASYSYRSVQVYKYGDTPWFRELQYRSLRPDDSHFSQVDKGAWSFGSQHRVQMPCVIIECSPRSNNRGYQLGDGSTVTQQDVLIHCLAENGSERNQLLSIFLGQFDKTIWLFDDYHAGVDGDLPLDYRGEKLDGSNTYEWLVREGSPYRWRTCRFNKTELTSKTDINSRLYEGVVRLTCEIILGV